MSARVFALSAALLFCSSSGLAQVGGLGSASLPARSEVSKAPPDSQVHSVPQKRDRFRARPDTYEPGRHRRPRVRPYAGPFYGYGYGYGYDEEPSVAPTEKLQLLPESPREAPARRETAEEPKAVLPPLATGPPRTFYVIPGCYAGDRPPVIERLPSDCDPSKLRVVPPERLSEREFPPR